MATWTGETVADVALIVARVASAIERSVYDGDPIVDTWDGEPVEIRERASRLRSFVDGLVEADIDELRTVLGAL